MSPLLYSESSRHPVAEPWRSDTTWSHPHKSPTKEEIIINLALQLKKLRCREETQVVQDDAAGRIGVRVGTHAGLSEFKSLLETAS